MRVVVDQDRCIASGLCMVACPEVFDQDEYGIVVVLDEHPPTELREKVQEAVGSCPAAVISTPPK